MGDMKKFFLGLFATCFIGGAAAAATFIGYAYPYGNLDLNKELGPTPLVVEMFTTPACIFCPVSDSFFGDLVKKAPIIAVSCPVDHLDVKVEPIGLKTCTQRHYGYAASIPTSTFTPLMIINGREPVVAYSYTKVLEALRKEAKTPPVHLNIKKMGKGTYSFDLPETEMGHVRGFSKDANIILIEYKKPTAKIIKDGDSQGVTTHYTHMASSVVKLEEWDGKAKTFSFPLTPDPSSEGAAILVQNRKVGIIAAGEIKF